MRQTHFSPWTARQSETFQSNKVTPLNGVSNTVQNDQEKQKFGEQLGDFALQQVRTGTKLSLSQALAGKKGAVVVFWSGVCSHCVRYDPFLNAFEKRHPELAFVAVASRHGETFESIEAAVKERNLTFPLLHDPGGKIAAAWYTQQTPRAFLMDANRNLLYRGAIQISNTPRILSSSLTCNTRSISS